MTTPVREAYFYLSHARAPSMVVDHWVRTFYEDLLACVGDLAPHNLELEIGFADFMPPGPDREAAIDRAVGGARVFVPLYSPEYLDAPPRDRAMFIDRLLAGGSEKSGHTQPVLWVPCPPGRTFPDLALATELGADVPGYARHGLSAMCRLKGHAENYHRVVRRLAERIIEAADVAPPAVALTRPPVEVTVASQADVSFVIAVIAPMESRLPPRRQAMCYGPRSTGWRPFRNSQALPIAEHTAHVAARFMMPTRVVDFAAGDNRLDTSPGVILIDPWMLAHDGGRAVLRAAFEALRQWVHLVVVVDRTDPQYDIGSALAADVMRMGSGSSGHKLVRDVREFEQQIGRLIARTRRSYLNRPLKAGPEAPPPTPIES
jgi:FxsC-like protein